METVTKGLIGEQDVNHYDGINGTFSRKTSTGGTFTLSQIGTEVDVLMAYGNGSDYTDSSIQSAISTIGTTRKAVLVLRSGAWTIGNNLSLPSNLSFRIVPGATVTVSSGKTLTLASAKQIDIGPYYVDVFAGTGNVTITGGNTYTASSLTATTLQNLSESSQWSLYRFVSSYTSLAAAITAIGATVCTLVVDEDETMTVDVTFPSTLALMGIKGAAITTTGYTLTLNGPVLAGRFPIFSGTGTVSGLKECFPEWFGATGDGTTNDYAAINRAIVACKRVVFDARTYKFGTTITAAAATSGLNLIGDNVNTILDYTAATGNGLAFAGEADSFYMSKIRITSSGSSTGVAIYSAQTSVAPFRNFKFEDVYIDGFKSGYHIEGGLNGLIDGGNITGQGKDVVGSIGINLGKDVNSAINQVTVRRVYVASYATDFYNVYASPCYLERSILGTSAIALRAAVGITYADGIYFDSNNDVAINKDAGAYLFYRGTVSSVGTQTFNIADHRFHDESTAVRVNVYRNAALSINGGPTAVVFDAAKEDTETYVNLTTGVFTAPIYGYYRISAFADFVATATDQVLTVSIYYNGSILNPPIGDDYGHSSSAAAFGAGKSLVLWLDKNDTIAVYITTSANLAKRTIELNIESLGW